MRSQGTLIGVCKEQVEEELAKNQNGSKIRLKIFVRSFKGANASTMLLQKSLQNPTPPFLFGLVG